MSQEADAQVRDRLYARTRTELLERQFANSDAYDKAILTLSSAFLALSLTFIKDILPRGQLAHSWALYASWLVLTLAIVGTVVSFRLSNSAIETQMERAKRYYLDEDESAFAKSRISRAVDILNWTTGLAFVAGVMLTIGFVTINFPEAKTVADTKQDGSFKGGHAVPTMQKVQVPDTTRGQSVPLMQQVGQGQQSSGQSGQSGNTQQTQSSGQQSTGQQTQNAQSTGGSSSTGDGVK